MRVVLVVEDEKSIREFVAINLAAAGYGVLEADNGKEALEIFQENSDEIDIALIDIMMPGMNGYELCKKIREITVQTGIIFLSARTQEVDKLTGFSAGADDYITKPFSISELHARMDSLYRRIEYSRSLVKNAPKDTITLGDFELAHIEFQVLQCFFSSPGEPIDRNAILKKVWGEPYYGDDKVVDVNIRRLRLKLEENPSNPVHLVTVWGQGYSWVK